MVTGIQNENWGHYQLTCLKILTYVQYLEIQIYSFQFYKFYKPNLYTDTCD
jgi:hypothetical protein